MSEQSQAQSDVLALIEQAAAEGWKELDLSDWDLVELPDEVVNLTQLERLVLGKEKTKSLSEQILEPFFNSLLLLLPAVLGKLVSLQSDCNSSQIGVMPRYV